MELHTRVALLKGNDHPRQPMKIGWVVSSALLDAFEDSLLNLLAIKPQFLVIQPVT
jgi:hypothetical protein